MNPLKKTVAPLSLSRAIVLVYNKGYITKTTQSKTIKTFFLELWMECITTRKLHPCETGTTQATAQTQNTWNLYGAILLDSGSTTKGTFLNPDLVTNIKPSNSPLDMSSNAGTNKIILQGDVNKFGYV